VLWQWQSGNHELLFGKKDTPSSSWESSESFLAQMVWGNGVDTALKA
jgi:hypothetical protein